MTMSINFYSYISQPNYGSLKAFNLFKLQTNKRENDSSLSKNYFSSKKSKTHIYVLNHKTQTWKIMIHFLGKTHFTILSKEALSLMLVT